MVDKGYEPRKGDIVVVTKVHPDDYHPCVTPGAVREVLALANQECPDGLDRDIWGGAADRWVIPGYHALWLSLEDFTVCQVRLAGEEDEAAYRLGGAAAVR